MDLTHTWLWVVIVSHWHVIVRSVDIERVLWVSLHSNDLAASLGRYIHQNAFELVIDGSRLDLNDDAEAWRFAMNSVSGCDR
jgi:hypothetical protein